MCVTNKGHMKCLECDIPTIGMATQQGNMTNDSDYHKIRVFIAVDNCTEVTLLSMYASTGNKCP